jgi:hypothetical protein
MVTPLKGKRSELKPTATAFSFEIRQRALSLRGANTKQFQRRRKRFQREKRVTHPMRRVFSEGERPVRVARDASRAEIAPQDVDPKPKIQPIY